MSPSGPRRNRHACVTELIASRFAQVRTAYCVTINLGQDTRANRTGTKPHAKPMYMNMHMSMYMYIYMYMYM